MNNNRDKRGSRAHKDKILGRPNLYWVISAAIALVTIRLVFWLLANASVVSEEDGNLMALLPLPVALFTIRWVAPRIL